MNRPEHALDVIQVKDPCPEDWNAMSGDEQVRFCGICEKNVFNLSSMTKVAAETLLAEKTERLCVRFYRRADGTLSTIDCSPIRFARARALAKRTLTGSAALFVSLLTLVMSLGLFQMSGADVGTWFEDTTVGRLAKAGGEWLVPDVDVMGEAPAFYPDEMGDEAYYAPPVTQTSVE